MIRMTNPRANSKNDFLQDIKDFLNDKMRQFSRIHDITT